MAKFLRISSQSITNSVDMFTLGVSTSTGRADRIGQFGSGSLMGVLLWLREFGESPIFSINGTKVEFESLPELKTDGEPFHRVFQIEKPKDGRAKRTPLSVSLEYGRIDWNEPRMALREWISNAIDNGADIRTCVELVDRVDFPPDQVCVFVPLNGECRKYWATIDQHFLHFTKSQETIIIEKPMISKCRVYRKGVFIRELEQNSIFDYNLNFSIDESRNGSSDSILSMIMETVCQEYGSGKLLPNQIETIVQHVRLNSDCIEVREQTWRAYVGEAYRPVLDKLVQLGVRFGGMDLEEDKVERIGAHWYGRFIRLVPAIDGFRDRSSAELAGHVVVDCTDAVQKNFDRYATLIAEMGLSNGKERPKLQVFKTRDGRKPDHLGCYANNIVAIWQDAETSKEVMLEELCHHYSGCADRTRGFQDYLFRMITEMSSYFRD